MSRQDALRALEALISRANDATLASEVKQIGGEFIAFADEHGPALLSGGGDDTARLDYIERTFSGMTNRERYLPVVMVWGKGCNGRTLREACDKYMKRDAMQSDSTEQETAR